MTPIDTLPAELFLEVIKHLRHHDLAQLTRVSTQYVTPRYEVC
jgi:hypothetical protein